MNTALSAVNRPAWRSVLDAQGRTLTWLAKATGTPRPTVYAYSSGAYRPSREWLAKVAAALQVPLALIAEEEVA